MNIQLILVTDISTLASTETQQELSNPALPAKNSVLLMKNFWLEFDEVLHIVILTYFPR